MTSGAAPGPSVGRYVLSGVLAILVLMLGFGVWATQARLSGAIIANGRVQPGQTSLEVQHPVGGRIADVLVAEGDRVTAGDVLARLDTQRQRTALVFARGQLFDLAARQDRLRAEYTDATEVVFAPEVLGREQEDPSLTAVLEGQRSLFAANRDTVREQIRKARQARRQIAAQLDGIAAQRVALGRQHALVATLLEKQRALLSRGLLPAVAALETEREASRLEGELAVLVSRRAEATERMAATETELAERQAARRERALIQARELDEQIRKYRSEVTALQAEVAAAELRAPTGGIVHRMRVSAPHEVLRAAEPLMQIVPQDPDRLITTEVQPSDIDAVRPGQAVVLRLAVLDHRIAPEVAGHVTRISPDAITDERRGTRHYVVTVKPDEGALEQLPPGAVLLPGMPVEVFIQTGAHSPLEFLTRPFVDYFAHAMREG